MFKLLLAAYLSTQTGDAITTTIALHQPASYREINPFLPHSLTPLLIEKGAIVAVTTFASWKWRQHHPKAAYTILIIGSAASGWATAHNIKELSKHPSNSRSN